MNAARELLAVEVELVKGAMGHSSFGEVEYVEAWRVVVDDFVVDDKVRAGGCGCQQERGAALAAEEEGMTGSWRTAAAVDCIEGCG
jgi:hypothetical protein